MTTGNNDFEPEYVSRCTDAIENIGRKYMIGIIFFTMAIASLTISELQGHHSSFYAKTTGAAMQTLPPVQLETNPTPLLHPTFSMTCNTETPVEHRNS